MTPSETIDNIIIALPEGREFDVRVVDAYGINRTKTNATGRMMELTRRGYAEKIGRQGGRIIWKRTAKRSDRDLTIPRELQGWAKIWPDLFRLPDLSGKSRLHECIGGR